MIRALLTAVLLLLMAGVGVSLAGIAAASAGADSNRIEHPQKHIMLRVVYVPTEWMTYDNTSGGWPTAVPLHAKLTEDFRWYEAAIWDDSATVNLYAFTPRFDPHFDWQRKQTPAQRIASRERYALKVHHGLPAKDSDLRSEFLRQAFEDFAEILVERHPDAEHHLMYHGHGAPGGRLFGWQLEPQDADSFLGHWAQQLGRKLGVIDMGEPCRKAGYEDIVNACRHARYYVASDLNTGGYPLDGDWTLERYEMLNLEDQLGRIFGEAETLEDALHQRVQLRFKQYEEAQNYLSAHNWELTLTAFECEAFNSFSEAFEAFLTDLELPAPWDYVDSDMLTFLTNHDAPGDLIKQFAAASLLRVDNSEFFDWDHAASGMITPIHKIHALQMKQHGWSYVH